MFRTNLAQPLEAVKVGRGSFLTHHLVDFLMMPLPPSTQRQSQPIKGCRPTKGSRPVGSIDLGTGKHVRPEESEKGRGSYVSTGANSNNALLGFSGLSPNPPKDGLGDSP